MSNGVRRDLLASGRRALARRRNPDAGNPFLEGIAGIGIVAAIALGFGVIGMIVAVISSLVF